MKPVLARKRVRHFTHLGRRRQDPYHWLKAENWAEVLRDPARCPAIIKRHLLSENRWTAHALKPARALEETLTAEMRARIAPADDSLPVLCGQWGYFLRYGEGQEHPLICRKKGRRTEIILNGNLLARGKPYFVFGGFAPSPDGKLLAWSADYSGGEYYTIAFRDLATRRKLKRSIASSSGAPVWAADGQSVFYIRMNEKHRPAAVYRHHLAGGEDEPVYVEKNPGYFLSLTKLTGGAYIAISSHDHTCSEIRLIDARHPARPPRLAAARRKNILYEMEHDPARKRFIILTNDRAKNYRLAIAPEKDPAAKNWKSLIRGRKQVLLLDVMVRRRHLILLEREKAQERIFLCGWGKNSKPHIIERPPPSSLSLGHSHDALSAYDAPFFRFHAGQLTAPAQQFDFYPASARQRLRKTASAPGHRSDLYDSCRLFAPARDGAKIPLSLFWRKGVQRPAPLLLYGYGAYGMTIPASFAPSRFPLVDRGFIYAIAHIRGGRACGQAWYEAGKLHKKKTSFTDFIDAADYLIARGWTAEKRITAHGGSAGGLLMGAVANMAPHLFNTVLAQVPFVDVLATMLDKELPLTPPEWPEWGNPVTGKRAYDTIAAYSPYDNIRAQAYPHIFATGGLTDPRVGYWEPAKWIARLRAHNRGKSLLCLQTDMGAGHGGQPGRYKRLEEIARLYAFALMADRLAAQDKAGKRGKAGKRAKSER